MALFIGLVAFGLWQIRSLVLVVLLAVVIASFVDSGVRVFRRIKIPRSIAVVIIYVLGFAVVAGALYIFVPVFLDELVGLLDLLPADSVVGNTLNLFGNGSLKETLAQLANDPSVNPFELVDRIREQISAVNIFESISSVFGGIVNFVLVIVISFYLSVLEDGVGQFLRIVTPVRHEQYVLDIWHRSQRKIAGWFRGQVLLAVIQGILVYMGLLIIGVPYALLLGLATLLLSLIPYGVVLAALPAIAIGYFAGGLPMGLLVLGMFIIFQQLENYLWQPIIIKRVTGVPSLVIILSLVIGAQLAGFIGLILAIPVAVVILEIINDTEQQKMKELKKEQNADNKEE